MRISAPTYTQTPNDLFDRWLPLLKESELKVLLVIMRKTFGWHKTQDIISISQLAKCTGLTEETVVIATKSLQRNGLIKKKVVGVPGKQQTIYELVVHEDSNNSYPSENPRPPLGFTPPGKSEAQKKVSLKESSIVVVCPNPLSGDSDALKNAKEDEQEQPQKIDKEEFWDHCDKDTWSQEEIEDAWVIYLLCKKPISNHFAYIDGILKNQRKKGILNKPLKNYKKKGTECDRYPQIWKKKSGNSKRKTWDTDT